MPRNFEKPLPAELLQQLPRALVQPGLYEEELERLAGQDSEEDEGPINNDHLFSTRYL